MARITNETNATNVHGAATCVLSVFPVHTQLVVINDASEIIRAVPAQHLDPFLLVQSQAKESTGFIVISYESSAAGDQDLFGEITPGRRFYDLLFFKGAGFLESARLNQDLRFLVKGEAAMATFRTLRMNGSTHVSLFQAPEQLLHHFRSTFYYEPCLKVQIESLSKKQIATLLRSSRCRHGIVESNDFTDATPSIHLSEITSEEDLAAFIPTFKHGRLLLYDIDKNQELIRQRYSRSSDYSPPIMPSMAGGGIPESKFSSSLPLLSSKPEEPMLSKVEADQFTEFIQQILNSPLSSNQPVSQVEVKNPVDGSVMTRPGIVVRIQEEIFPLRDETKGRASVTPLQDKRTAPKLKIEIESTKTPPELKKSPPELKNKVKDRINRPSRQSKPGAEEADQPPVPGQGQHSEYIRTFERLFRSFRQQLFEYYGDKCEEIISSAEKKTRLLIPEFECHTLTDESACHILEVIEEMIRQASFLKRPKLRQAAVTLISDLYNKKYSLLEEHRVIDIVEQVYYRLKK